MGTELEVHLTGEDTGGSLFVAVDHPAPGFQLFPHLHDSEDETIHIVDGSFEFMLDGETRMLGPGDTVHVPRGTRHGIRNTGDTPGHRVLVFHPAGIEGFFLAADGLTDGDEILALAAKFGWRFG